MNLTWFLNVIQFVYSFYLNKIKNKMPNKTYFHETWLVDSRFMEWIAQSVSKKQAHYKVC